MLFNKSILFKQKPKTLKSMGIENIIDYAKSKPQVSEETPFGPQTLVYKVAGKIFLLLSLDDFPNKISVKCKPDIAIELREKYDFISGGYHLNKKHWNTIILKNYVNFEFILEQIDNSYYLVVNALSKKLQSEILQLR